MVKSSLPMPAQDFFLKYYKHFLNRAIGRGKKAIQIPENALTQMIDKMHRQCKSSNKELDVISAKAKKICSLYHWNTPVRIEVNRDVITSATSSSQLVKGKIKFQSALSGQMLPLDCFLASGHWNRLKDIKTPTINLIDHLPLFLPPKDDRKTSKRPIGLVTFQNGIMNSLEDFRKMSQQIVTHFPEGPLCIGIHNPTTGNLVSDLKRFVAEEILNEKAFFSLAGLMITMAEQLPKINPQLIWLHFAHSEGGLIASEVIDSLERWRLKDVQKTIKNQLVTSTYGPVKPIARESVLGATNTYSNKDIVLFFGEKFLNKPLDQITDEVYTSRKEVEGKTYDVTVVKSVTVENPLIGLKFQMPPVLSLEARLKLSFLEMLAYQQELADAPVVTYTTIHFINQKHHAIKDHAFAEISYISALKRNIETLKVPYRVYDTRNVR